MLMPTNWVAWSGIPWGPSRYHAVALIVRLDTWSLPLSVKRGSHVIGRYQEAWTGAMTADAITCEVGWTVGVLCFYLCWGFA